MTAVASFAALVSALRAAQGGEVFELPKGDFPGARINAIPIKYTTPVRVIGNDTTILGSFQIEDAQNIHFEGIKFGIPEADQDYDWCIRFYRSLAMKFLHCEFFGREMPAVGTATEYMLGYGFMGLPSGSEVSDSFFHDLNRAISYGGNDFTLKRNDVTRVSEGFQGSNVKKADISGNRFWDFRPKAGDHPDAIQFHGSGGPNSCQDVNIYENMFDSILGRGMQGIFMRNEYKHGHLSDPAVPFHERIHIFDNLIIDGWWNSIFCEDALKILIERNRVYCIKDRPMNKKVIRVGYGDGIVRDNQAHTYQGLGTDSKYENINNITTPYITVEQAQAFSDQWLSKYRGVTPLPEPDPRIAELELKVAALEAEVSAKTISMEQANTHIKDLESMVNELGLQKTALVDKLTQVKAIVA